MNSQNDCEYAKLEKWSDVVYKCDNLSLCVFEMIYGGSKYCAWSIEKEQRINELEKKVKGDTNAKVGKIKE